MADILLIEPNYQLGRAYATVLERKGHTVRHHTQGQAAIEAADQQAPDCVVVELQLAGHNGLEFLYEFRSYPEWQAVPVLVLTDIPYHAVGQSAAWPLVGVAAYLYKPAVKLSTVADSVEELLQTARA